MGMKTFPEDFAASDLSKHYILQFFLFLFLINAAFVWFLASGFYQMALVTFSFL